MHIKAGIQNNACSGKLFQLLQQLPEQRLIIGYKLRPAAAVDAR